MSASNQQKMAMLTYFESASNRPVNRAVDKWSAGDLIDSYGIDAVKQAIDYYCQRVEDPTWKKFVYRIEDIFEKLEDYNRDQERRAEMRRKFKEILGEH